MLRSAPEYIANRLCLFLSFSSFGDPEDYAFWLCHFLGHFTDISKALYKVRCISIVYPLFPKIYCIMSSLNVIKPLCGVTHTRTFTHTKKYKQCHEFTNDVEGFRYRLCQNRASCTIESGKVSSVIKQWRLKSRWWNFWKLKLIELLSSELE